MGTRRVRLLLLAAAALAATAVLVPAAGDWLVTRDGDRIETRGPWRVEGRLVVFTQPDGTLASMRASEVDLEASRRATEEAAARSAAPAEAAAQSPAERRSVLRLTEKELPPVARTPELAGDGAEASAGAPDDAAREPAEAGGLEIVSWRDLSTADAADQEFLGVVRNTAAHAVVGIRVKAVLYDVEGQPAATADAVVSTRALPPGQQTNFRATFPGRYAYDRVEFTAEGQLVLSGPQPEAPAAAEPVDG